ncbi:hypothetical protein M0R19_05100 [Candidatus Pacearchaeota archaeon]|jgi:DnaJ-class molecular chaperone|nr:hypothetical protein [Candidatus Pacearchaeota archaeon]
MRKEYEIKIYQKCKHCNGRKIVRDYVPNNSVFSMGSRAWDHECDACNGTGKVLIDLKELDNISKFEKLLCNEK